MSLSPPSERGSALIGVLLLLMMMSALTAAFAVSGHTETLVVRNHQAAAQARAAAEAGLNYAVQQTIEWLALWPDTYTTGSQAVNALLDNPDTVGFDFGTDTAFDVSGQNIEYVVELMDEDDDRRGFIPPLTFEDDDDSSNNEDGDPGNDDNMSVVVRAVGRGQNNAAVTLEAIVSPLKLPAIVTNGDLTVSGSVEIVAGNNGGVHTNGNLTMSNTAVVAGINPDDPLDLIGGLPNGTATASGTYAAGAGTVTTGDDGGGYAVKTLPKVRASFYRSWADYILESDGRLTCAKAGGCSFTTYSGQLGLIATTTTHANGATICDGAANGNLCRSQFGWVYDDDPVNWNLNLNSPTHPDGTFYVEGAASISGSPGSAVDPINLTLLAEGSIDISGAANLTSASTEILFVTDGDLQITGNFNMPLAEGQILVHEQVRINASAVVILGQIVIEDAVDLDSLVTANSIQGLVLSYTGDVGNTIFSVSGWREVR